MLYLFPKHFPCISLPPCCCHLATSRYWHLGVVFSVCVLCFHLVAVTLQPRGIGTLVWSSLYVYFASTLLLSPCNLEVLAPWCGLLCMCTLLPPCCCHLATSRYWHLGVVFSVCVLCFHLVAVTLQPRGIGTLVWSSLYVYFASTLLLSPCNLEVLAPWCGLLCMCTLLPPCCCHLATSRYWHLGVVFSVCVLCFHLVAVTLQPRGIGTLVWSSLYVYFASTLLLPCNLEVLAPWCGLLCMCTLLPPCCCHLATSRYWHLGVVFSVCVLCFHLVAVTLQPRGTGTLVWSSLYVYFASTLLLSPCNLEVLAPWCGLLCMCTLLPPCCCHLATSRYWHLGVVFSVCVLCFHLVAVTLQPRGIGTLVWSSLYVYFASTLLLSPCNLEVLAPWCGLLCMCTLLPPCCCHLATSRYWHLGVVFSVCVLCFHLVAVTLQPRGIGTLVWSSLYVYFASTLLLSPCNLEVLAPWCGLLCMCTLLPPCCCHLATSRYWHLGVVFSVCVLCFHLVAVTLQPRGIGTLVWSSLYVYFASTLLLSPCNLEVLAPWCGLLCMCTLLPPCCCHLATSRYWHLGVVFSVCVLCFHLVAVTLQPRGIGTLVWSSLYVYFASTLLLSPCNLEVLAPWGGLLCMCTLLPPCCCHLATSRYWHLGVVFSVCVLCFHLVAVTLQPRGIGTLVWSSLYVYFASTLLLSPCNLEVLAPWCGLLCMCTLLPPCCCHLATSRYWHLGVVFSVCVLCFHLVAVTLQPRGTGTLVWSSLYVYFASTLLLSPCNLEVLAPWCGLLCMCTLLPPCCCHLATSRYWHLGVVFSVCVLCFHLVAVTLQPRGIGTLVWSSLYVYFASTLLLSPCNLEVLAPWCGLLCMWTLLPPCCYLATSRY